MDDIEDDWEVTDDDAVPFASNPVPNANPNVVRVLDGFKTDFTDTPLANHPATAPSTWSKIESGAWNAAQRGWFERGTGDNRRRIVLLGEAHNQMEHFLEHMFEDKATRIWEKNLHLREVAKRREGYAKWYSLLNDKQQRYFDSTLDALGKGNAPPEHILDSDSEDLTGMVTVALRNAIGAKTAELIGRLIAADTEIYDQIAEWIAKPEPKHLAHLDKERRRWRFLTVLVGAQHYPGLKHYITTLGGFAEVRAGPALFIRSLQS
jgi:hypothetical protein